MKQAVLSLSGGMDSSTLLLHLLANGYEVTALSFDYGQKHKVELIRAKELVEYLNNEGHNIKHQVIKIDGLSKLLNSTLVEGGADVPEGHYAEENMKDTVVPNRNKIFSSIIQAAALSIADLICVGLKTARFFSPNSSTYKLSKPMSLITSAFCLMILNWPSDIKRLAAGLETGAKLPLTNSNNLLMWSGFS